MRKFKVNHIFPYRFYRLPIATQVIFFRLRALADRCARVDINTGVINYHLKSNPSKLMTIDKAEASRIFSDLYVDEQPV